MVSTSDRSSVSVLSGKQNRSSVSLQRASPGKHNRSAVSLQRPAPGQQKKSTVSLPTTTSGKQNQAPANRQSSSSGQQNKTSPTRPRSSIGQQNKPAVSGQSSARQQIQPSTSGQSSARQQNQPSTSGQSSARQQNQPSTSGQSSARQQSEHVVSRHASSIEQQVKSSVSLPRSSPSVPKLPIVFCENHRGKELLWHCLGHDIMVCNSCRTAHHKLCQLISVQEIVETSAATGMKVMADIAATFAGLKTRLDKVRRSREQSLSDITGITKSCETKARRFKERIIDWAEELEQNMLVEIRRAATARMTAISEQLKGCNGLLYKVERDTKVTSEVKSVLDEPRTFVAAHQLSKSAKDIGKYVTAIEQEPYGVGMTFKPDRNLSLLLKSGGRLGTLKVDSEISESSGATVATKSLRDMAVVSATEVHVDSDWITGSTFMPDGRLVLADRRNHKLILLTKDLSTSMTSELRLSSKPCNVAVNSLKDMIVTLPDEKKLQYVSAGTILHTESSIRTNKPCWGVAVHSGEIYVTLHNNPGDGEVQVLDRFGEIKRRIGVDADGRGTFHCPYYLAIGTRGTVLIYVSDNHGEVACYNRTGDPIYRVQHRDMKAPSGLLVDRAGKLFVCSGEGGNTVHVLKADGRKDQVFLGSRDGVDKPPLSVAYRSSDDTLILTLWGKLSLRAFKLK